jgi:hypothetical protein
MNKKIILSYQFEDDKGSCKKLYAPPKLYEFKLKVKIILFNFFRYHNHVKLNSSPLIIRNKESILLLKRRNNIRIF